MYRHSPLLILLSFLASSFPVLAQDKAEFTVSAGEFDRNSSPIFVELPKTFEGNSLLEVKDESENSIAVQRLGEKQIVFLLAKPLPKESTRKFTIETIQSDKKSRLNEKLVTVADDENDLTIFVRKKPVLKYAMAVRESPEGIESFYRRSGHIHPLFDPMGREITDDFAPDHAHQHGIFFAWTNTSYLGKKIDFWNQKKKQGNVKHLKKVSTTNGNVFAHLKVVQAHSVHGTEPESKLVLKESWNVRVYAIDDYFMVDLHSEQENVSSEPLIINKYHYGGFGIRGNRKWLDEKSESGFLTSESKDRLAGNHTRPRWTSMFGKLKGKFSNVTVLDSAENFRHPQPVRLHPTKPYFCQAPLVIGEFSIKPGEKYRSSYRMIVSTGKPDSERLDQLEREFNNTVKVKWRSE